MLNISVNLLLSIFRISEGYLTFPKALKFFFFWNDADSSGDNLLDESGFSDTSTARRESLRLESIHRKRGTTKFSSLHLSNIKEVNFV
jgi:hypothetical protein